LVENQEDWDALPKGLPRILASKEELPFITIFLEFQTLYRSCVKTKLPIKWLDCLKRIGYNDVKMQKFQLNSGGEFFESDESSREKIELDDFVSQEYIVDFDKLSELKILPIWLDDIRASVETNIINEVIFDPTAFNKQLGINVGASAVKQNLKNLLILDVSGSIPKSVVVTITNLAKLMSKRFYADVMITSGKTVLIDYEDVPTSDIVEIARLSGYNNEGSMYKKIVEEVRDYNTVIAFGDNDHPIGFNGSDKALNPKFNIQTIYSLHTDNKSDEVVGYARYLKAKTVIKEKDWVNTVDK
jgi:hypothetical protein